jgi:hypothetical protein
MQDLLNPKQKLFVAALVAGASLAQAAQKAGYAKASSGKTGGRLIREAAVSHALAQAQGRIAAAAALTADDIIAKLDRAYEAALAADPVQARATTVDTCDVRHYMRDGRSPMAGPPPPPGHLDRPGGGGCEGAHPTHASHAHTRINIGEKVCRL